MIRETVEIQDRAKFMRQYRQRMDRIYTGCTIDTLIAARTGGIFRATDWHELGLPDDLSDAPFIAGSTNAPTEEARAAGEAWAAWMHVVTTERLDEIVIAALKPEALRDRTLPVAAICRPDWPSIKQATRTLFPSGFDSWVAFSESDAWALYCHCENFAILGCSVPFMHAFRAHFGEIGRLRESFGAYVEEILASAWPDDYQIIPGLIRWPPESSSQG